MIFLLAHKGRALPRVANIFEFEDKVCSLYFNTSTFVDVIEFNMLKIDLCIDLELLCII
jgi:hypothetical protein